MKPLNRKMFRDPRAAKRATGILASSTPLMTAAQKAMMQGQPVKAQVGTSVNTQNRTILQDLARLPVDVRSGIAQIFSNVSPQNRRAVQYPLEYFGMPVPDNAPGVPVGNPLKDLNRLFSNLPTYNPSEKTPDSTLEAALPTVAAARQKQRDQLAAAQRMASMEPLGEGSGVSRMMSMEPLGPGEALRVARLTAPGAGIDEGEAAGLDSGVVLEPKKDEGKKDDTGADEPTKEVSKVDPALDAAKKSNQELEAQLANIRGGGDTSTEMNLLTTGTAEQRVAPSGGQPESQKDVADFGLEYAQLVKPEEVSLSDIEKRAKEIMGFDPSEAEEDRKNSFWMNLTRAGLAIAAGESENALTNVAKGLSFGLEGYAKDTARIDAKDEAQRKEYRATLRTMIKDEKDASIATARMMNSYNQSVNALKQNAAIAARQDLTARDLAKLRDDTARDLAAARNAITSQGMEFQLTAAIAKNKIDIARLESDASYRQEKLDSDELYRTQMLAIEQWKAQPNLVKIGQALGYTDGENWTPTGLLWANSMASKALSGGSKELQQATTQRFIQDIVKNATNKQAAIDGLMDTLASSNITLPDDKPISDNDLVGYLTALDDQIGGNAEAVTNWVTGFAARNQ